MSAGAVGYAKENSGRFLEELKTLLRIPSVSTTPEHKGDVEKAAEWVAAELKRIGMENVRLIETTTVAAKRPSSCCQERSEVPVVPVAIHRRCRLFARAARFY